MNPEQQRIAIAEACGWKARHDANKCDGVTIFRCGACGEIGHSNCYGNGQGAILFSCSVSPCCNEAAPPDYLNDLNAMRGASDILNDNQQWQFVQHLNEITRNKDHSDAEDWFIQNTDWIWRMLNATASQRAEAFLRTIGKWEDGK